MPRKYLRSAAIVAAIALVAMVAAVALYLATPRLLRIEVTPSAFVLRTGERQTLSLRAVYSDGTVRAPTELLEWTASEGGIVGIEVTTAGAVALGVSPGVTTVMARIGDETGFALLAVTDRPPPRGPLRQVAAVRRHFVAADGRAVWLTGSHVWTNLQDMGDTDPPLRFNYDAYLDFLVAHGHNFIRLWRSEQANWVPGRRGDLFVHPQPWVRTGPGVGLDGKVKFDLDQFDPTYFARLRERVDAARRRGVFVSVMLFNGWSVEPKGPALENPWRGHPFHRDNNVNELDGDNERRETGRATHTLAAPAAVLMYQRAYVRRVVETLNDLDNVLYEISNESTGGSMPWQTYWVRFIHELEMRMPMQHPVGVTAERPGESNDALFETPADWISPFRYNNRPLDPFPGHGDRVILSDTDHLCGVCGSVPWAWKTLLRGQGALLMDPYDAQVAALGGADEQLRNEDWPAIRRNMGYARVLSEWIDVTGAQPWGGLVSSGYALANFAGAETRYLAYANDARRLKIDTGTDGEAEVRWLELATGRLTDPLRATNKGTVDVEVPFQGDAVLLLTVRRAR